MSTSTFLSATALLNFNHPTIARVLKKREWAALSTYDGIGAVYNYVRDEIDFGYNRSDAIPASEVIKDGYGQCNTKAILLMALFRAIGIESRLHGFTIHKDLQRGVVPEILYPMAPDNIVHSWVEIRYQGRWIHLEGFILDNAYLKQLQRFVGGDTKGYCGYGVGTTNLQTPGVDWIGSDTYIQSTAINQDYGVFASPDAFYEIHGQDFSWWKRLLYRTIFRHWMNKRVRNIRTGHKPRPLPLAGCRPALTPEDKKTYTTR